MKTRKPLAGTALALSAAVALAGCSGPAADEAVTGGTLAIGLDTDITSLDPIDNLVAHQSTLIVGNAVYEPLFLDGPEGGLVPGLAESIETDDLTDWTLTLKPGLAFSDGSPLDAEAVIAHFERMADPESTCLCQPAAAQIDSAEAADDTTVRLTLAAPDAAFDRNLTRSLGMITTPPEGDGEPLGAGAFAVASTEPGASVTLKPNPEYHGSAPLLDELVFRFLPDTDSRYQSLSSGTVDMVWLHTANLVAQAQTEGLTTAIANSTTATAFLNTTRPPFDDVRVRQAVQAAINREVILEAADQGVGNLSDGPIGSGSPYSVRTDYPEFDPDRARRLLADYGEPVAFDYTTDARPQSAQRAAVIQQMLADVGIEMTIDTVDAATMDTRMFGRDFDAIEFFTSAYGETDTAMKSIFPAEAPGNFAGYDNSEVTGLIGRAAETADAGERAELYGSAAQIIVDEAPILFYTESPSGFAASYTVGGIPDLSEHNVISFLPSELWINR
ncbi:ABC transporter substrate-binding protein [Nocardiopsis composta]|uniref:Peptide/nickel transport system substrate-binding protein n=1 Tax=Nocardiopsis composta TaxID=157465 RepID=A0A7W8QHE5_9ACTN|nr:ABC transporter substrate-binding protein [Nocardiopsis composta]MBB5430517.1 peptide/nickel transport system substrate-binding protein [Nocardiopsis composta]